MRKSFWMYQAPEPPSLEEAIAAGAIKAGSSEAEWSKLSPGYRREIVRSAKKRQEG